MIAAGVSSVFGAISFIAYLYFLSMTTRAVSAQRSLISIIEGEGLDEARMIGLIKDFGDEERRLKALESYLAHTAKTGDRAQQIYAKIKTIDLQAIALTDISSRRRLFLISTAAFLIFAALGTAFWYWNPHPTPGPIALSIEQLRVFDPKYRTGSPGNYSVSRLDRLTGNVLRPLSADDFLMPVGFVVRGFGVDRMKNAKLSVKLIGRNQADGEAWVVPDQEFNGRDDWMKTEAAKAPTVGSEGILNALGNPEAPGEKTYPLVLLVQCATREELNGWAGKVDVEVTDKLLHQTVRERLVVDFKTDRLAAAKSHRCP